MTTPSSNSSIPREVMECDLLIVGGGPAGLAAAIEAAKQAKAQGKEISVFLIEKGSEIGAHILSGAVMDPVAINELWATWQADGAPLRQAVTEDRFLFLGEKKSHQTPNFMLPTIFKNHGNYIISLGSLCRWLGEKAVELGVEVLPGFAGAEVLYDEQNRVCGVATGDLGIGRDGQATAQFARGVEIRARYTLFAEGCRGHLGKSLIARYGLANQSGHQTYGIGLKELWEVPTANHSPGLVVHTAGWPLDSKTYGGSFLYHGENNQIAVGFVVGLAYRNPYLSPYGEFQRYKHHPDIAHFFKGGKRLVYGARAIVAGGLTSLPHLIFPGGALIGDDAGFLNAARIKGSHAAIKTGMLAAQAVVTALAAGRSHDLLSDYPEAFRQSWLYQELHRSRNFKQWMAKGLYTGTMMVGLEQKVLGGNIPWTLQHHAPDHTQLLPASQCTPIDYPKPDGVLSFDRLSSVFLSNTNHEENQPIHLTLKDQSVPVSLNLATYAGPEARYCPAGVYEFVSDTSHATPSQRLQINAQNCVHCKTCDIKDPTQNIHWVVPQGGEGPSYPGM